MVAEPWDIDTDLWADLAAAARPALSGLVRDARPAWHARAACRMSGLDWFSVDDEDATRAVCEACPVRMSCAEAGRTERFGMWGGEARNMGSTPRRMVGTPGGMLRRPGS